jgi:ribosome-associated translation inhibitor RaiA
LTTNTLSGLAANISLAILCPSGQFGHLIPVYSSITAFLVKRSVETSFCAFNVVARSKNNKIVEIQLVLPGQTLFNSKQADTFEDATLQVVDATKMQLSKYKERFNKKNGELKSDLYEMSKEEIGDEQFDNLEEFDKENEQ